MLTRDLLRYRMSGEYAKIQFISPEDHRLLALASTLISLFENAVHCTREDLEEQLSPVINGSPDIILTRGLVKLLLDRSLFSGREFAGQDLPARRHTLFRKSMELLDSPECPENPFTFRDQVWDSFPEWEERKVYCDLPEYETLLSVRKIYPKELLERYNVALVQSMILYAGEMVCTLPAEDPAQLRRFFKYLKFFRLLCKAELKKGKETSHRIQLHIDGPASLLEHSSKYGLNLACFFPAVCTFPRWKISCDLKIREKKIRLSLDEKSALQWSYSNFGAYIPEEFKLFSEYFLQKQEEMPWKMVVRESFLRLEKGQLVFPDFRFRHDATSLEVDVELFHEWHKHELTQRLAYLEKHPEIPLLLGTDRSCLKKDAVLEERFRSREGNFLFSNFPGVENVMKALEKYRLSLEKQSLCKRKRADRLRKDS